MTKRVLSEKDGFKGMVYFAMPLKLDQVHAIELAQDSAVEIEPSAFLSRIAQARGEGEKMSWSSRLDEIYLPAILKCVEKFEIDGIPEKPTLEDFPMTPRPKVSAFLAFLFSELLNIYGGETDIPNAS